MYCNPRYSGVNCRQSNVRKFAATYLVQIPGKIRLKCVEIKKLNIEQNDMKLREMALLNAVYVLTECQ
jgi:hypothetical protein